MYDLIHMHYMRAHHMHTHTQSFFHGCSLFGPIVSVTLTHLTLLHFFLSRTFLNVV